MAEPPRLESDGGLPADALRDTQQLADGTPLVDPGSNSRFGHRGDAKRTKPLLEQGPLGAIGGHVKVTPIERGDGLVYFEVLAEWGPDSQGRDVIGLAGQPSHHVTDTYATRDPEAAIALAKLAADRLQHATTRDPYALDEPAGRTPPLDLPAAAKLLGVPLFSFR